MSKTDVKLKGTEVVNGLSELELEKIREVQKNKSLISNEFGDIGMADFELSKRKENLKTFVEKMKQDEFALLTSLNEKYGKINVNLETGEYQVAQE